LGIVLCYSFFMEDRFDISTQATEKRIRYERGSPVTDRDWDSYPYIFNFKDIPKEYWKGKNILDVGSGIKWRDPDHTFPGATIFAIDPEFANGSYSRITINTAHNQRLGVVQEIPYDDNTFDHVVSSHAMPQHVYPIDHDKATSEMIRVMKPGGDIRLAPCIERDLNTEALKKAGFKVDFTEETTEGKLAIITLPEFIRSETDPVKQLQLKVEAWQKFHEATLPQDPIREDFNSILYAKHMVNSSR
jgi:ubiquinone/menaquinone biosynthesis C-methylase UbiE